MYINIRKNWTNLTLDDKHKDEVSILKYYFLWNF